MGGALVQVLLLVLPWPLRRALLKGLFGFEIGEGARIGLSVIRARSVRLGAGARIGHLTYVKGLDRLEIGEAGFLGNLNWVTAEPRGSKAFAHRQNRDPSLLIGDHASVTHRHLIDCADRVEIGAFASVGGWRSQILSHSVDLAAGRQDCAPIRVGTYAFVGTGVILLKGAGLPDHSVLSAGSVLGKAFDQPHGLYSGVPATRVRDLDPEAAYFTRAVGYVD